MHVRAVVVVLGEALAQGHREAVVPVDVIDDPLGVVHVVTRDGVAQLVEHVVEVQHFDHPFGLSVFGTASAVKFDKSALRSVVYVRSAVRHVLRCHVEHFGRNVGKDI